MTDSTEKKTPSTDPDAGLANLMKLAGERAKIPLSIESRIHHRVQREWRASMAKSNADKIYEAVHRSWRRKALRTRLRHWLVPTGIAATVVIAVLSILQPETVPVRVAASVSRVIGSGDLLAEHPQGSAVYADELISTQSGEGISLLLARGESLRLDENTRIRIEAADHFTLLAGRLYADSGQFIYRDGGLRVDTAFGVVTDIGTQFSVAVTDRALDVAVREGRVDVVSQRATHAARMGERLTLIPGERASLGRLEAYDDYWSWIVERTPSFDMTGRSLLDFLKWAARETGRELRFQTNESRMSAMRTDLHGSTAGMTPDEALVSTLATTRFEYRIEIGRIVITL